MLDTLEPPQTIPSQPLTSPQESQEPPIAANPPTPPRKANGQLTQELAKALQLRAAKSRHLNRLAKPLAGQIGKPSQLPQPKPLPPANPIPDKWIADRIAGLRAQIERMERKMSECDDPRDMERLATAYARVADVEQRLSGRPSPGSLRPTAAKGGSARLELE
jgi:hypothetical protein